jgi:hypothetical protein
MKREDVVTKLKKESSVVEHFWRRWHKEYLVDLRESHKMHQQKDKPSIAVGDVEEKGAKRNERKLVKIEELVVGRDGVVRGAKVRTSTEKGAKGMIHRPLQKMYPLVVVDDQTLSRDENSDENVVSMNHTDGPSSVPMTLDTLTSQMTQNSKTESMPFGVEFLSKNMSNTPSLSSSQSRSTSEESPTTKSVQKGEDMKSYGSTTTSRPKRTAGMVGEAKRRVERK